MSQTQVLKFKGSKGAQKPEGFVGDPKDILEESINHGPLEPAGLTGALTEASDEKVEINSVL